MILIILEMKKHIDEKLSLKKRYLHKLAKKMMIVFLRF